MTLSLNLQLGLSPRQTIDPLGPNIFVSPTVTAPWVDNGGGNYSIDGSQVGNTDLFVSGDIESGTTWEISLDVVSTDGALAALAAGSTGVISGLTGMQTIEIVTAGGGTKYGIRAAAGRVSTIQLVTIRKQL